MKLPRIKIPHLIVAVGPGPKLIDQPSLYARRLRLRCATFCLDTRRTAAEHKEAADATAAELQAEIGQLRQDIAEAREAVEAAQRTLFGGEE